MDSQFYFYNIKEHQWENLPRFHNLHHLASFITVDGSLYAAGGISKTYQYWLCFDSDDEDSDEELRVKRIDKECTDEFQVYDVAQCSWEYLPSMITARHNFPLLYLDRCIYAVGGEDEHEKKMTSVERYNMAKKEWESVASLPERFTMSCATVYQDKILVKGDSYDPHPDFDYMVSVKILVYDPSKNEWKIGWRSQSDFGGDSTWFGYDGTAATPVMFNHNGTCYDVTYYPQDFDMEVYIEQPEPTVTALKIGEGADTIEMSKWSYEIDNFTLNKVGAFQIKNEIFLNVRGFVYDPNIKLTEEQVEEGEEVDLEKWENLAVLLDHDSSMIVNYTFDRKKLGPYLQRPRHGKTPAADGPQTDDEEEGDDEVVEIGESCCIA